MSWLADTKGRKLVICVSLAGSAAAYLVQGLAPLGCGSGDGLDRSGSTTPCSHGFVVLLVGKALAGCFGGTFATVLAFVAELSGPAASYKGAHCANAIVMLVSGKHSARSLSGANSVGLEF